MGNMSYCRFRNTERDLEDCYDNWGLDNLTMSPEEKDARARLLVLCEQIVEDYSED